MYTSIFTQPPSQAYTGKEVFLMEKPQRPWSRYYNYDTDYEYQAAQEQYLAELLKIREKQKAGISVDISHIKTNLTKLGRIDANGNLLPNRKDS